MFVFFFVPLLLFLTLILWFWNPRLRKRLISLEDVVLSGRDPDPINANEFYSQYHGHPILSLQTLEESLREQGKRIIWLVGDSSLDNKYWLGSNYSMMYSAQLCNGYEKIISPSVGIPDVSYWLNYFLCEANSNYAAINCAVEASTLYDRGDCLLNHDQFVRNHLQKDDVVIFSVGGNDIALNPSLRVLVCLAFAIYLIPESLLSHLFVKFLFLAPLKDLFRTQMKSYAERICANQMPSQLIFCSYYYPCLHGFGWADVFLRLANYKANPGKIQKLFDIVSKDFSVNGNDFPGIVLRRVDFSKVLCPDNESDYIARVEPSNTGGKKMAESLFHVIHF